MNKFPAAIQNLINQFTKLPGIGPKTAERLTFYLIKKPTGEIKQFAEALAQVSANIINCPTCYNLTENNLCGICSDKRRKQGAICIVAEVFDLLTIENTGEYHGLYHVLGGYLDPLEGITPEYLKIKELVERVRKNPPQEIILALNPDVNGETTSTYLSKLLKSLNVKKITRLARGLPMGSNLEYADEVTLLSALRGRQDS